MRNCGLYIHIPFCLQKCAYCDFYSFSSDKKTKDSYINALTLHMKRLSPSMEDVCIDTVYIGGGTPGLLSPSQMGYMLAMIYKCFHIHPQAEISMETNPAADASETLLAARRGGVNRLSIGLQSVHERELKTLGRLHRYDEFLETIKVARDVGFENISADLMYGIPHQTLGSLTESIDRLAALKPTHISLYGLRVEEGTPFGRMGDDLILPDEDAQCEMYTQAVRRLSEYGYQRYEISNFALNGFECRHNLRYWQRDEYLGLGPGAHSFYNGVRYSYPRSLDDYVKALEQGSLPVTDSFEPVTPDDIKTEEIILGLRLAKGIMATDVLLNKCRNYLREGFMEINNGRLTFTTKGFLVSNAILAELID